VENKKNILNIRIVVLIFIVSTIFVCCQNDIETVNKIRERNKLPTIRIENFETTYSDSGKLKIKMISPELVRYDKSERNYDEYSKGLYVEFYNNFYEVEATLRCRYARYLIEKDLWEAKFDVEVNNLSSGEKLNTELLYWDVKKELIYSDKFVRITRPDEILFGEGFESDQDFSKWKILKPTGSINIKDE
jgi:LPS export ABC transporter protein LptC